MRVYLQEPSGGWKLYEGEDLSAEFRNRGIYVANYAMIEQDATIGQGALIEQGATIGQGRSYRSWSGYQAGRDYREERYDREGRQNGYLWSTWKTSFLSNRIHRQEKRFALLHRMLLREQRKVSKESYGDSR